MSNVPRAGVTSGREPPSVGTGKRAQLPCEISICASLLGGLTPPETSICFVLLGRFQLSWCVWYTLLLKAYWTLKVIFMAIL